MNFKCWPNRKLWLMWVLMMRYCIQVYLTPRYNWICVMFRDNVCWSRVWLHKKKNKNRSVFFSLKFTSAMHMRLKSNTCSLYFKKSTRIKKTRRSIPKSTRIHLTLILSTKACKHIKVNGQKRRKKKRVARVAYLYNQALSIWALNSEQVPKGLLSKLYYIGGCPFFFYMASCPRWTQNFNLRLYIYVYFQNFYIYPYDFLFSHINIYADAVFFFFSASLIVRLLLRFPILKLLQEVIFPTV